jgi:hypothetical protein
MGMHGLVHRKRKCPFCIVHPMSLCYEESVQNRFVWKCTFCFKAIPVQKSTIISNMNVRKFDTALTLWMMNARTVTAARMFNQRTRSLTRGCTEYFHLFRKAYSHYAQKKIVPYLVLPGIVEIDESKVNHKRF